jgi:polyhydroxyalkanoate synthase
MTEPVNEAADQAAGALAPEFDLFAEQDTASFARALGTVARSLGNQPMAVAEATGAFLAQMSQVPGAAIARWLGAEGTPPFEADARDRRFADAAWEDNPLYFGARQAYLGLSRLTKQLIATAPVDPMTAGKAGLAAEVMLDAAAPTNFLVTNPAAL